MNMQTPVTAADQDQNSFVSVRDASHKDLLVYAARAKVAVRCCKSNVNSARWRNPTAV